MELQTQSQHQKSSHEVELSQLRQERDHLVTRLQDMAENIKAAAQLHEQEVFSLREEC